MGIVEFESTVDSIREYVDGDYVTRIVRIKVPEGCGFTFTTGQAAFVGHDSIKNLTDPTRLKWGIFSIASSPLELKQNFVDFCVTAHTPEGISYFLTKKVAVGDKVRVKGAFGHYGLKDGYDHYYFTATGAGIAPYMSMIKTFVGEGRKGKLTLFFGFRKSGLYLYQEELEQFVKEGKLELITTISREDPTWKGNHGYVQEHITKYTFPANEKKCIYVCGSPAMIDEVKKAATAKGFAETDILVEKW